MKPNVSGWLFVAVQAVLVGALVVLPGRSDWPTPTWVAALGSGFVLAGLAFAGVAALRLGRSLTPTPVPRDDGVLATTGLYRFVRHPIYTGVLAVVVGLTVSSGSLISLAVGVTTVAFFDRKARWEEARLSERYDGYAAYASVTPRFVPRLGARLGRP